MQPSFNYEKEYGLASLFWEIILQLSSSDCKYTVQEFSCSIWMFVSYCYSSATVHLMYFYLLLSPELHFDPVIVLTIGFLLTKT